VTIDTIRIYLWYMKTQINLKTGELQLSTTAQMNPRLESLVLEARSEYLQGKTSGPFFTPTDLMKHLDK